MQALLNYFQMFMKNNVLWQVKLGKEKKIKSIFPKTTFLLILTGN
jgi:hypothetical protein